MCFTISLIIDSAEELQLLQLVITVTDRIIMRFYINAGLSS